MYVETLHGPVYATHDAGGRVHLCPAMLRYAADSVFRARVVARTAARLAVRK